MIPQYNDKVKATCACGATFEIGSTLADISIEICSNCHPFYTGKATILDTAGRVEKFKQRREAAEKASASAKASADKKKAASASKPKETTEKKTKKATTEA